MSRETIFSDNIPNFDYIAPWIAFGAWLTGVNGGLGGIYACK
jgi:hypothetical protein